MPASSFKPTSFEQIPVELGAAEMLTTHELGRGYALRIEPARLKRLQSTSLDTWSTSDRQAVAAVAHGIRPYHYLARLGTLDLDWYEAILPVSEIQEVLVIDIPEFTAITCSRRVGELAGRLDAGARTSDDRFSAKYRAMRPGFHPDRMKERPMTLAQTDEGPYTEFEGLTRLCCIASRYSKGDESASVVPILLGVGERVREWQPFYGRP